ncbi:protein-ER retention protein [Basidiobolus ranarum]|uniref:Protein-ER retention protein n=1 Tax=Basidiobolus ranarum TaxID=34480 RepID=A0ABR2W437_9FUNG
MADSFIPFEYRTLFLIDLGIWCWGLNVQLLNKAGIDVQVLFGFKKTDEQAHRVFYKIALVFTSITLVFLNLFWYAAKFNYKGLVVTGVCYSVLIFLTICPFNILYKKKRYSFLSSLIRVVYSPIRSEPSFGDIILADILTSFAKVIVGVFFAFCAFFASSNSNTLVSDYIHHSFELLVMGPLITSLPFIFRFRQCISEYLTSKGTGYKSLANAGKYASAFPVIFLSASMHNPSQEDSHLFSIWLLAVIFNSLYSFYWDVVMDWDLCVTFSTSKKSRMIELRDVLMYREPVYYISIFIDFFLRTTWSLKLSENMKSEDLIAGGFILEAAEILRRWLWVYFRVEKEWISAEFNKLNDNYSLQPFSSLQPDEELNSNPMMHELL